MKQLQSFFDFQGTTDQFIKASEACALLLGWEWEPDRVTERLVRYYVSEGLVDRPERRGREAYYGYRHLIQLLLALRYADAKITLPRIAQFNESQPTPALEKRLARPVPTPAEFEIELMRSGVLESARSPSSRPSSPKFAPPPMSSRSLALADLLDEIQRIRRGWTGDAGLLRQMEQSLRDGQGDLADLRQSIKQLRQEVLSRLDEIDRRQSAHEALLREWVNGSRRR